MAIDLSKFIVYCEKLGKAKKYSLKFPYHQQLVELIKKLPNDDRSYDPNGKFWILTTQALFHFIKQFKGEETIHFEFVGVGSREIFIQQIKTILAKEKEKEEKIKELEGKKQYWLKFKTELEENYEKYSKQVHKHLKEGVKLYPFQISAVIYSDLIKNALLALEMGTGKSVISIALCEMNKFKKVFVITPNSLKFNYYYEVEKFTNSKAYIIGWKKNKYTISESRYIITNYEYLNSSDFNKVESKFNNLKIGEIDCLITDECHRLKSTNSNTYKNFKRIFKDDIFTNEPRKLFMSGTPCPNKSHELYVPLNQISKIDFPTKKYFCEFYCGMVWTKEDDFGSWKTDFSQTKFEELYRKLEPFMFRKKKKDVLKDLPEKTYQKVLLQMTEKEYEIYYQIEEGIANEFTEKIIRNPLTLLGKLREYTSFLKVNNTRELIDSVLETGEKFVAIDFYKKSLYKLQEYYPEVSKLHTGDCKDFERSEIVKDFQDENGSCKLFLGSESTTREGLTLTSASKIGLLTIPYNPGILDQVTDRLCRIGQKNAVSAYLFIYEDSIDEYLLNLVESKRSEITQVIDNERYYSDIEESIINDLIKIIKDKHRKIK